MPDTTLSINLTINGQKVSVPSGTVVAAAVATADQSRFRRSISGQPRAPLCGMGICFECRVTIDGTTHARSCTVLVREGMEVRTDA